MAAIKEEGRGTLPIGSVGMVMIAPFADLIVVAYRASTNRQED
jgi:hypothetical protein